MTDTQQNILLRELRKGKVNSYYATYSLKIKQAPTRIKELKQLGHTIISTKKTDRSVDWELLNSPIVKEVKQSSSFDVNDYVLVGSTFVHKSNLRQEALL